MMNFLAVAALQLALSANADAAAPEPQANVEHRSIASQIYDGMWHAKINMRYHIIEARTYGRFDRATRAATIIFALVAFSGPFVFQRINRGKFIWYSVGFIALSFSLLQFIWPYGEWTASDTVLAGRWNQLAGNWYALYEQQELLDRPEALERIADLTREEVSIENSETPARFKPKVMLAAEDEEKAYQGFKNQPAPVPDKPASS